jgi:GH15 family glucan-1,4-alpha-glucosidase
VARYPSIGDHGLIGDLQTAALVTTDGVLDWFCCPRFDSPSVFASLLDAERGGFYRIAPDRDDYVSRQLYLPDTAILITRFMTPDGVGEVHDFMPVIEGAATARHRLVRNIRAGRLDDARLVFEKMHTYANHLGLYSEEIGSTGEQLGNFPQAFSHLSLISAAVNRDRHLNDTAGPGRQ